ncbi:unnamed protein product, partial [Mesorhabditis spiculigera]
MKRPSNGHTAPRADGGRGGDRGGPPGSRTIHLTGQPLSESDLMSELPKKKFTGRCRLFVGNLSHDLKEDELKELFRTHGEVAECYLSGKGFAFVNMDTRAHAESAKEALDGTQHRGRTLRQQPNPFSGGPPGPFGVPSLAVPPPTHHHQQQHPQHQQQQFAPPPQQGNPNGPRPNVIEGVQRLLQLFKNDDGRGAEPGNQQNMQQNHPGGAFNDYQPR